MEASQFHVHIHRKMLFLFFLLQINSLQNHNYPNLYRGKPISCTYIQKMPLQIKRLQKHNYTTYIEASQFHVHIHMTFLLNWTNQHKPSNPYNYIFSMTRIQMRSCFYPPKKNIKSNGKRKRYPGHRRRSTSVGEADLAAAATPEHVAGEGSGEGDVMCSWSWLGVVMFSECPSIPDRVRLLYYDASEVV